MPLEFTTASREGANHGVKAMVYGGAGMGKTVLCATMPRPVMLSAESGLLSLQKVNLERIYGANQSWVTYDMPVIQIRNVSDLSEAYEWLTRSHEAKGFDSICMDSASEIAEQVLNNAKRQVKDPRQAYGELIEKMETAIRTYRDIRGKHVLITAKMEPSKDELTGIVTYGPAMPGQKLGPKLPYFFDEVFRLGVNKDPQGVDFRFLQTQPDLQHVAKDRSGMLDPMEAPNMASVLYKISQGRPLVTPAPEAIPAAPSAPEAPQAPPVPPAP